MIQQAIEWVEARQHLTLSEMSSVIDEVMQGCCSEPQIEQLLVALHNKGETVEELAGAAASLRRHMTPIRSRHPKLLDTCGTGGDRSGTFNISTAAALVTAAAGIPVAKHGNRSITSRSGSADVLAELGVNIQADVPTIERCLDELGICFCFAPLMHPSMKHVATVRRKIGSPTIFNLLGPLCNPAAAQFQLLGVGHPQLRERLAAALCLLGSRRAAVVNGCDGLDEVTLSGPSSVSVIEEGSIQDIVWTPQEFGLAPASLAPLQISGPVESAAMIHTVLSAKSGPARDIVLLNAAAAIWIAQHANSPQEAAAIAADAVDSGAALRLLHQLAEASYRR